MKTKPACHHFKNTDEYEELLVDGRSFNVREEAKAFIGLLFSGRMTYAQCREAILMTPTQLRWLISHKMDKAVTLRRVYGYRKKTWRTFRGMFKQAMQKAMAA